MLRIQGVAEVCRRHCVGKTDERHGRSIFRIDVGTVEEVLRKLIAIESRIENMIYWRELVNLEESTQVFSQHI